jgi:hypothetical protein
MPLPLSRNAANHGIPRIVPMNTNDRGASAGSLGEPGRDTEIHQIREALRGLRYGTVTIIVQDGVVIQIDRTEKRRLRRSSADSQGG